MHLDREILHDLYERYAGRVYRRCFYLLRNEDEAADAMHDVFLKALNNIDGFRAQASPLTWLTKIATNHCFNLLRAKRALWRQELVQMARVEVAVEKGEQLQFERGQLLRAVLARCDDKVQELAVFYFVDEMTQEEIAELVGLSVPTVRKRIKLFLEQARRELAQLLPGAELADCV